ncbi:transcriptional regulator [Spirochaetia bacterium]|nr:transcriptional regulator [Spirochaetia bacterium]
MNLTPGNMRGPFWHYLPYSEEDENLGMVCANVGSMEVSPNTEYPPYKNEHPALFRSVAEGRVLPTFQIIYITAGRGILEVENTAYTLRPGSVFILHPMMKHRYKPVFEIGWHEYWVGFQGEYFTRLMERGVLSRERIFFEAGLHDFMISAFNQIIEEVKTQRPLFQLKACSLIVSLLAEILTRERRKDQPNSYQKIVEKTKYLMETNIFSAINLSDIAEQIGVSTSRLNEIFKTYTSMTPYQYFIHIKILKAESLLEQKDASVKEVAYNLGFEDQYHFSRLFKSKTGIAPSDWHKLIWG